MYSPIVSSLPFAFYCICICSITCLQAFAEDPFASLVRTSGPLTAQEELGKFKLPAGFRMELIACEPVVNKTVNLAFDASGNLWVTSSREYPWAIPKEKWANPDGTLTESRDKIVVFRDSNGDHVPDQPKTFVDNLNVPTGVIPYGKGCIAWSIPNIWYFADNDGDGICDERKILFGPLGWEKDTHGNLSSFRLAPDGWIYATHGFSNNTRLEVRPENTTGGLPKNSNRKPTPNAENWPLGPDALDFGFSLELNSGNVFRFRPDGSRVEPWAWGQVNPFGLTWDSHGNLYSADCHSNPLTQIIPGAYYPSFGKPHDGLGFGPVLCSHSHGSTGICGPLYLHSGVWGADFDDNLLVCNPVTSRINRDRVEFRGATPIAREMPDFLTTEDPWFRPVDIQLAPDGSLYIADFYNKIIGHYEVPLTHPERDRERGRIWRLVKTDAKPWAGNRTFQPAAGAQARPAELRELSVQMQRKQSAYGLGTLLTSLESCPAEDETLRHHLKIIIRDTLRYPDGFSVLKTLELGKVEEAVAQIIRSMRTPAAAEWLLGYLDRHPSDVHVMKDTLSQLARQLPASGEPVLVRMVKKHFASDIPNQVTLLNLLATGVQQRGGQPAAESIAWASELASSLLEKFQHSPEGAWRLEKVGQGGSPWKMDARKSASGGPDVPVLSSLPLPRSREVERLTGNLVSQNFPCPPNFDFELCGHRGTPDAVPHEKCAVRLLDAATGAVLITAFPPRNDLTHKVSWDLQAHAGKLVRLMIEDQDKGDAYAWLAFGNLQPAVVPLEPPGVGVASQIIEIVRNWHLQSLVPQLAALWPATANDPALRNALLQTMGNTPGQEKVLANWFKGAPSGSQIAIAENLASTETGTATLCDLGAAWVLKSPSVAAKLSALPAGPLKQRVETLAASAPTRDAQVEKAILDRIAEYRLPGKVAHPEKGLAIFTTNCSICHRLGSLGNIVGPQLDGIGNRGLERLCEDILDPSREVDPAFHLQIFTLKDQSIRSGLVRRREGESIVLADATGQESRLDAQQVVKTEASPYSLMPASFHASIPAEDFRELLAWLLGQKVGK